MGLDRVVGRFSSARGVEQGVLLLERSKLKAWRPSTREESLISVIRALPPAEAGKVMDWAPQLSDLAGGRAVEWSDSWTDEDLAEATTAALRRFEDQEREGC